VVFSALSSDDNEKRALQKAVIRELSGIPEIKDIKMQFGPVASNRQSLPPKRPIPGVTYTIPVASGKGGVGKSTVTVNLAAALSLKGLKVGILDLDIYGPNIPLMVGVQERPAFASDGKICPLEKFDIRLMSIGFFLEEDTALIWRGPMVMKAVRQLLFDVEWGRLDYLIIDLPPGTGDAQLTLVQSVPITAAIVVTTPQDVALLDAKKAVTLFRKTNTPVLGIIENMSYFLCPHCHGRSEIFGHGGGKHYSEQLKVPFLGEIPLHLSVRECGDEGLPVVLSNKDAEITKAFISVADKVKSFLYRCVCSTDR
ncbi:MAG: Mrp/NBP35 family ATP-binding protein, partial [candidate division KSB1 bacterium]|nr:Mrp/NBP35 family ATP-binding protein [candidate division KSB1 bacterium]